MKPRRTGNLRYHTGNKRHISGNEWFLRGMSPRKTLIFSHKRLSRSIFVPQSANTASCAAALAALAGLAERWLGSGGHGGAARNTDSRPACMAIRRLTEKLRR
jgi:hypothetical protein